MFTLCAGAFLPHLPAGDWRLETGGRPRGWRTQANIRRSHEHGGGNAGPGRQRARAFRSGRPVAIEVRLVVADALGITSRSQVPRHLELCSRSRGARRGAATRPASPTAATSPPRLAPPVRRIQRTAHPPPALPCTLGADTLAVAAGFPTTAMTLWSGTGKRLGAAAVSVTLPDGTTGYTLKRASLYKALRDQATSRASTSSTASA